MKIYSDWDSLKHLLPPLLLGVLFAAVSCTVYYVGNSINKQMEKENEEMIKKVVDEALKNKK